MSIDENSKFRIKPGIPWQILDGNVIILAPEKRMAHELNEVGSEIWQHLAENMTTGNIISRLKDTFDADHETATQDTFSFISELTSQDLLEPLYE